MFRWLLRLNPIDVLYALLVGTVLHLSREEDNIAALLLDFEAFGFNV
jgi:hypothetical protein